MNTAPKRRQHGLTRLLEQEGHPARAFGRLIADMCDSLGMRGKVAVYGELPAGFGHMLVARMLEANPGLAIDVSHPDILSIARIINKLRSQSDG